jgi:hypothetical protein
MPRRSLSAAQQRVHKPDKSMAQKWRWRRRGAARCRRVRQAEGIFRNADRVLRNQHAPVRAIKPHRHCSQLFAICVRALKGFDQSVMAVTGSAARYSCRRYDPDEFVLQDTEHLPNHAAAMLSGQSPDEHYVS